MLRFERAIKHALSATIIKTAVYIKQLHYQLKSSVIVLRGDILWKILSLISGKLIFRISLEIKVSNYCFFPVGFGWFFG